MLKNKQDAEEAFQDTFMKIYRSLDKYNYSSSFGTWSYKIAYNTGLDYLRKRKRNTTIDLESAQNEFTNPTENLEKNQVTFKLERYLCLLHPEDEQIIRLYYLKEMSISEVLEITGMTNSNIKTKLFRSRKKLLDMMSEEDIAEFKAYYNE
jgi:RNA polymerase sigma-70 factor (ECF subfamily)